MVLSVGYCQGKNNIIFAVTKHVFFQEMTSHFFIECCAARAKFCLSAC